MQAIFIALHNVCGRRESDRLYEQEADLLEAAGFDLEDAGARLLGRDAARLCDSPTLESFVHSEVWAPPRPSF